MPVSDAEWAEIQAAERVRERAERAADAAYFGRLAPDAEERIRTEEAELPNWWGECIQEWRTAQQLLTDAGIAVGKTQAGGDLDSRIARWIVPMIGRMSRIAEAHSKQVDEHGGTSGDCIECGWTWPCPTYAWATGYGTPGLSTWNPADNETPDDCVA